MKKQNLVLLLLSSTMLLSCGVKEEPSYTSSETPNSSDTSVTPGTSDTSVTPTPITKTLEEIKKNILATSFKGYSFVDKSDKTVEGTVTLGTKSILIEGKASFEEESVPNMIYYRGIEGNLFYDIENFTTRKATKQNVSTEESENHITEASALELIKEAPYSASWITGDVLSFFNDGVSVTSEVKEEKNKAYSVTLDAYLGGTATAKANLSFSEDDKLQTVDYVKSVWAEDEFDSVTKEPIDPDGKPTSKVSKKGTLVLGEIGEENFDVTPYFVTSVPDFYVSSYDDIKKNSGKAIVGKTIHLEVESYLPATALNDNEIQIISSSNTEVIDKNILGLFEAKKKGTSTLTISDLSRSFTETIEMVVETPPLTALWLTANNGKEVEIEKTLDLKVEFYDAASEEEFSAVSTNESVLSIVGLSGDRKTLTVKGVAVGTSDVYLKNKTGEITSKKITITVKEKGQTPAEDVAWLIGEWEGSEDTTSMIFKTDGTGTFKQYSRTYSFGWKYENKELSFPEDQWPSNAPLSVYSIETKYNNTTIIITWDDYGETYRESFTKAQLSKPA